MSNSIRFILILWGVVLQLACKKDATTIHFIETEPAILTANSVVINNAIHGFYSGLPAHYNDDTINYPLLIWLHGAGQVGNGASDLPMLLYGGIPNLLNKKTFPASFTVKGINYSFIVLSPQFRWGPTSEGIISFIDYAKKNYRIDNARIYLTGLSMGSIAATEIAAAYPSVFAAIVPIAGVFTNELNKKCENLAIGNLPIWVFQNREDELFNVNDARNFVSVLKSYKGKIPPKYSEFLPYGDRGHDAWTKATNPAYKESGLNIYEWMLQYSR